MEKFGNDFDTHGKAMLLTQYGLSEQQLSRAPTVLQVAVRIAVVKLITVLGKEKASAKKINECRQLVKEKVDDIWPYASKHKTR